MKVAVSIPDELFEAAERLAARLGASRSRLYATALAEFLAKQQSRKLTERLNAVYDVEESALTRDVRRLQGRSLERNGW